jgi:hypothetical protein
MPDSVEIPAPVNTTIWRASRSQLATVSSSVLTATAPG